MQLYLSDKDQQFIIPSAGSSAPGYYVDLHLRVAMVFSTVSIIPNCPIYTGVVCVLAIDYSFFRIYSEYFCWFLTE